VREGGEGKNPGGGKVPHVLNGMPELKREGTEWDSKSGGDGTKSGAGPVFQWEKKAQKRVGKKRRDQNTRNLQGGKGGAVLGTGGFKGQ